MSLPQVSYGTYSYGQYANPTPIQYKGGLGQVAAVAYAGIRNIQKKQEEKIRKANEDSYIVSSQFNARMNEIFGKAASYNRKFLTDLKVEVGNNYKDYKLGKKSFDEYREQQDYYDKILNDAALLASTMQPVIEDDKTLKYADVRGNQDDQAANTMRFGVQNGKYILDRNEDGLQIVVPHGTPTNFTPKAVQASEVINNPRYITPELAYENENNPFFLSHATVLADALIANENANSYVTRSDNANTKLSTFQLQDNPEIKDFLLNQPLALNTSVFRSGEDKMFDENLQRIYYEDEVLGDLDEKDRIGAYKGTPEQIAEINKALAEDYFEFLKKAPSIKSFSFTPGGDDDPYTRTQKQRIRENLENFNMYKDDAESLARYIATNPNDYEAIIAKGAAIGLEVGVEQLGDSENYTYSFKNTNPFSRGFAKFMGGGNYNVASGIEQLWRAIGAVEGNINYNSLPLSDGETLNNLLSENRKREQAIVNIQAERKKESDATNDPLYNLGVRGIANYDGDRYSVYDTGDEEADLDRMMADNYKKYFIQQSSGKLKYFPVVASQESYDEDRKLMEKLRKDKIAALKQLKVKYPGVEF
jgi:hypothetical protein|tara:strand:- start:2200 stop:3969 length:1770 start_codon:yes stop_codon:yes gene_type:complete